MEVSRFGNNYGFFNPDLPIDWKMHNQGITPIFFTEPVNLYELDGKTPRPGPDGKCTREQEYVRILIAGDGLCEAAHIVDDLIKERFEEEYKAWKENREAAHGKHTLEEWPAIFSTKWGNLPPPKVLAEMHSVNIFSVEDLAALSDANLNMVHNGRALREKAIAWLADKEGHAVTDKLAEENAVMKTQLEAMQRQMAKMEAARKPKRRKRMSGGMRRKLNEERVRKAPIPSPEQPPVPAAQSATPV